MLKDELKSQIDLCFNQVTTRMFSREYGADWFEKELIPYMRNIRCYSDDEKLIGEYERFIFHNNNFSNADTTICAKLLLFDERYSHLVGRTEGWQLLKHLLYYRNECSHSVQDITANVYRDGLNSVEKAKNLFLKNTVEKNLQSNNIRCGNSEDNEIKRYYDDVRRKVGNILDWFQRILCLVSLVGVVAGCIFIFIHRENSLRWWMSDGLNVLPYIYIAYIVVSVGGMLEKLDNSPKYERSTSGIQIIFLNVLYVVMACVVNIGYALVMFASMGMGVLIVNVLEWLLGLVVKGISFSSMLKAGFVCATLFFGHICLFFRSIIAIYKKALYKKIEKHQALIFKCPKCKTKMRVANGVKKILITCPNCKKQFMRHRAWRNIFIPKK